MTRRNTTIRDRHRAVLRRGEPPCAICGEPIDYQAKYPEPKSFVVDHIVPLDLGGTDTLDNKQPSCRACNAAKSNKAYAEGIIRRSGALVRPGDPVR